MKQFFLFIVVCFYCLEANALENQESNQRKKFNFNQEWLVKVGDIHGVAAMNYNDKTWQKISFPYVLSDEQKTEVVWFRKHFRLPSNSKNKKIFLEFEEISSNATIYVNGRQIYQYSNSCSAIGLDISDAVRGNGNNVIAVRIDNTLNDNPWPNPQYKGVPGNVILHICSQVYQTLPLYSSLNTTGTYIYARQMDITNHTANLYVETEVRNESGMSQTIDLEVVVEDKNGRSIGRFQGNTTVIENNSSKILKTAFPIENIQFWSWRFGQLYDVYTIVKANGLPIDIQKTATGFRKTGFRHGTVYLNDKAIYLKGYTQNLNNGWATVGYATPAWLSDLTHRMMVKGNANIVRWTHTTPPKQEIESCDRMGLMQIISAGDSDTYSEVNAKQWQQRKEIMRDAIIYNRNNPSIIFYECGNWDITEDQMQEMIAIRNQYDPYGGRAIGTNSLLHNSNAEYGGANEVAKSATRPLICTNYGHQDSSVVNNLNAWANLYDERPGISPRACAGTISQQTFANGMYIPNENYFINQTLWDGWVNTENAHTHILGHWNHQTGSTRKVQIISTGESVELRLNGKSLGTNPIRNFICTFENIAWETGTLEAISYDKDQRETSRDKVQTHGIPVALQLNVSCAPNGLKADGSDMALLQITSVDANGTPCTTDNRPITCSLQGEGRFVGNPSMNMQHGTARILIRSTFSTGNITLSAQGDGLTSPPTTFTSIASNNKKGLNPDFDEASLPPYLQREETSASNPATPLKLVEIIDAITLANNHSSKFSYDDNERSEWSNNGLLSSASITYELEKETNISYICMKLANTANVSYPLLISFNDQKVEYTTPKEKKYIRINIPKPNKPTKFVTISLNVPKDTTLENTKELLGSLRIVEIEFYENVQN